MKTLKGKSVAPGFAQGKVVLYTTPELEDVPIYNIDNEDIEQEHARFHRAILYSFRELEMVREKVLSKLGETEAEIFDSHLSLLRDQVFVRKVRDRVKDELVNVEHAICVEIEDLDDLLSAVESEYLSERAQYLQDVGRMVVKHLGQDTNGYLRCLPPDSILVTRELFPSETFSLDRRNVAGFLTERGGYATSAAILARSLGVPFISGITGICEKVSNGMPVLVNGEEGIAFLKPSENEVATFSMKQTVYKRQSAIALENLHMPTVTGDGQTVSLMGNINHEEEAEQIVRNNLDGVGLFRTEYLLIGTREQPDTDTQTKLYKRAAENLKGRPMVIRTFDLGGDHTPSFIRRQFEPNPSLGLRGLRFSLQEKELFEAQVKAVLRASVDYDIRLMFPMVIGTGDLREATDIVKQLMATEGIEKTPQMGAMLETPAALYQLDRIIKQVDFVSIGTNDLTQFILAADRHAVNMLDAYSVLHPSVLSAIRQTLSECEKFGCPVSICGEAAGDPKIAAFLVGLGARSLSVIPERSARVRQALRVLDAGTCSEMADEIIQNGDIEDMRRKVEDISLGFEEYISTKELNLVGQE